MSSAQKDFYTLLGLHENAETAVIKAAYKALIMIYHPDRYAGDKAKAVKLAKDINEAYSVLIDPEKRKHYDAARLSKSLQTSPKTGTSVVVINELKRTLKESEAILDILNSADD